MITVEIRGAKEAQQAFEKAGEKLPRALEEGLYDFAQDLRAYLKAKGYPGKRPYKMIFFSERQRRFIGMMARRGGLGHSRSGNLANSFSVRGAGLNYVVFNSAGYAGYVIGDGTQAYMHAGNWWTISSAADPKQAEIAEFIETKIITILP